MSFGEMTPTRSTGLLGLVGKTPSPQFLGTAFAYRSCRHFITAAHCVGDLEPSAISLTLPLDPPRACTVEKIARHPTADLAILTLPEEVAEVDPFIDVNFGGATQQGRIGIRFYAFGYPEDFLDYFGPRVRGVPS